MSYREPAPRSPRLWAVALAWKEGSTSAQTGTVRSYIYWEWAVEADDAITQARLRATGAPAQSDVWYAEALCGEDFAEREAKGPPKPAETPK